MEFTENMKQYREKEVLPSNILHAARETFIKNSFIDGERIPESEEISEKSVVYQIGVMLLMVLLELKTNIKKILVESHIIEKQKSGTFLLNFSQNDFQLKGGSQILQYIFKYASKCIDLDPSKRPMLSELGVFITLCQKGYDYFYS